MNGFWFSVIAFSVYIALYIALWTRLVFYVNSDSGANTPRFSINALATFRFLNGVFSLFGLYAVARLLGFWLYGN